MCTDRVSFLFTVSPIVTLHIRVVFECSTPCGSIAFHAFCDKPDFPNRQFPLILKHRIASRISTEGTTNSLQIAGVQYRKISHFPLLYPWWSCVRGMYMDTYINIKHVQTTAISVTQICTWCFRRVKLNVYFLFHVGFDVTGWFFFHHRITVMRKVSRFDYHHVTRMVTSYKSKYFRHIRIHYQQDTKCYCNVRLFVSRNTNMRD